MTPGPDSITELDFEKHCVDWSTILRGNKPVIIRGAVRSWPAFGKWTWDYLSSQHGDREYTAEVNLPTGVPTLHMTKDFTRKMRLREFLELLGSTPFNRPCYLHQRPMRQFPGLEQDVCFNKLTGALNEQEPFINMWIGSAGTKSSLHFDFQHGLLAQIRGTKRWWVIDPRASHWLSVIPGVIQKSQVDPEAPDYGRFPRFKNARILVDVREGDIIYVPVGWWHAVRGQSPSISVNYFYGPIMGFWARVPYVMAGGYRTWLAVVRDFVRHGMLGVNLPGRLYSAEPFGLWFYHQVVGYVRKRVGA